MAITDYAAYIAMQEHPDQEIVYTKNLISLAVGLTGSYWLAAPFAGSAPTTAVVPTNATTGAIAQFINGGSGAMRLPKMQIGHYLPSTLMLVDRLSHQGGLSAANISAQTTNLPTAALTRYTSGVGVFAALEIYTVIGTTATTVTASYTDTTPTAGRTSIATVFGGTNRREASSMVILPLQEGDIGVKSVESVTVLVSTATAGNFGVTLFKPLMMIPVQPSGSNITIYDPLLNHGGNLPEILDNACLQWIWLSGSTGSSGSLNATMAFAEDR
jgi:hypothetical protein